MTVNSSDNNFSQQSIMAIRFFFFEDMRLNLLLYFSITTLIMYLGPETLMPSLKKSSMQSVPIIKAPCGDIAGTPMTSRHGRAIDAYKGIPYAQPPVGQLRFARTKPLEYPAWEDVFDGSINGHKCFQLTGIPLFNYDGQEDCLNLNVYVPAARNGQKSRKPLPVMVWFHGGGFTSGDSLPLLYGPRNLLDRDVILVTANYRLGILGFLTLGVDDTFDINGNQGMWDQTEVLSWVQKNIGAFGGNKHKVTIFGESAGGMGVTYHLVSERSKGLYQAAIPQSGVIHMPFTEAEDSKPMPELHREYASVIGCPVDSDVHKAVKCLKAKTPQEIYKDMFKFDQCSIMPLGMMAFPAVWSPADDSSYSRKPFFSKTPRSLLESGFVSKVPIMIGATKDEGLIHMGPLVQDKTKFDYLLNNWYECGASNFLGVFFKEEVDPKHKQLLDEIKTFYFGDKEISLDQTFTNLTNLFSDPGFLYGAASTAKLMSEKGTNPVYFYLFDHAGSFSFGDLFSTPPAGTLAIILGKMLNYHTTKGMGVSHADDLLYLFSSELPFTLLPDEADQKMSDVFVDLWANFATFHNPTPSKETLDNVELVSDSFQSLPQWRPYGDQGTKYVRIKDASIVTEPDDDRNSRIAFWHDIFRRKND